MKANILIDDARRARVADFGLSTVTGVATRAAAGPPRSSLISDDTLMSFTGGGTHRWMSPELLHPERFGMLESENNRPTRQSDCYALGMVIYEVGDQPIRFCRRLTCDTLGFVRVPPIPGDPVGHSGRSCDHGRGSTAEAGRGKTPRIW